MVCEIVCVRVLSADKKENRQIKCEMWTAEREKGTAKKSDSGYKNQIFITHKVIR